MKFLRNPITVGILALVAVGMLVHSLYPHLRGRPRRATPARSTPAPTPAAAMALTPLEKPTASAPLQTDKAPTAATAMTMDLDLIRAGADRWLQARRDPFQLRTVAARPMYPPAREVLFLSAVWRQTDSSLAVLNNRIYAAGDRVLRYTLSSIEADQVWVQGPNGREAVGFRSVQTVRTNLPQNLSLGSTMGLSTGR
jgi:hypothetical protein